MTAMRDLRPDLALKKLSPTELRIVRLIEQGETNGTIADKLHISIKTVQSHGAKINAKLGVHSRPDLIIFLHRAGRALGAAGGSLEDLLTHYRARHVTPSGGPAHGSVDISWDPELFAELAAEGIRLERSYSWVAQQAWRRARDVIRAIEA